MKAVIILMALQNQSVKDKQTGVRISSVAEKTFHQFDVQVDDTLPKVKKVNTLAHVAGRILASKLEALHFVGKRLPSTLVAQFTLNGEVFRTDTLAIKAQMSSSIKLNINKKVKELPAADFINAVANQFSDSIRGAQRVISNIQREMKAFEAAGYEVPTLVTSVQSLFVGKAGVLEAIEAPIEVVAATEA